MTRQDTSFDRAKALSAVAADAEAILRAGVLPKAPLVMPKQHLEHAPGHWLRRLPLFGATARTGA